MHLSPESLALGAAALLHADLKQVSLSRHLRQHVDWTMAATAC